MRDTVYIFARAPRMGAVKRRLARDVGDLAALRFYRATLGATVRKLRRDRRLRVVLAVTPDRDATAARRWTLGLPTVPQGPGDVGQRMARVAGRHRRGRVAIVGSDIPDLTAADVVFGLRLLGRAAATFGPATDGGYWFVALGPRRPSQPFAIVRWSSEWALEDTLANFVGRQVALLRDLSDVDTGADLAQWRARA